MTGSDIGLGVGNRMDDWADRELDRQLDTLLARGYPRLAGMDDGAFRALVDPLRDVVRGIVGSAGTDGSPLRVPFLLVVSSALVPAEDAVPFVTLDGGAAPGIVDRNHGEQGLAPYRPLPELGVPEPPMYLLVGIERGEEFRGVRPGDATATILERRRTPLTIEEGIALVTQFPGVLEPNHCFMLSGSRRGDRRVPALWISGKAAKLGWCWEGNPHSWLGTASAARRAA